jgi:NAD(P)H-flavin reductase
MTVQRDIKKGPDLPEPGIRRQAFLCGPPLMIEAVTRVLQEKGTNDIFYDEF